MAWPPNVTDNVDVVAAAHINSIVAAIQTWQGNVNAGGFTLLNVAAISSTGPLAVNPSGGNVGIGTLMPNVKLSLGTDLADVKMAIYDDGTELYGIGVQSAVLRYVASSAFGSARHGFFCGANEYFSVAIGAIRMYLGGSLKTLSVDGSGFVKAT